MSCILYGYHRDRYGADADNYDNDDWDDDDDSRVKLVVHMLNVVVQKFLLLL